MSAPRSRVGAGAAGPGPQHSAGSVRSLNHGGAGSSVPWGRGPFFALAALLGLVFAFFGVVFGRRRRDYVSPETLGRLAMADGGGEALPALAPGPRGQGRRDLDACERADRARREVFRTPYGGQVQ